MLRNSHHLVNIVNKKSNLFPLGLYDDNPGEVSFLSVGETEPEPDINHRYNITPEIDDTLDKLRRVRQPGDFRYSQYFIKKNA